MRNAALNAVYRNVGDLRNIVREIAWKESETGASLRNWVFFAHIISQKDAKWKAQKAFCFTMFFWTIKDAKSFKVTKGKDTLILMIGWRAINEKKTGAIYCWLCLCVKRWKECKSAFKKNIFLSRGFVWEDRNRYIII